ncbi:MAG: glutamine synthetase family protein [Ktedonobacterales bacterium]
MDQERLQPMEPIEPINSSGSPKVHPTGVKEPGGIYHILQQVQARDVRFINLEFCDVVGITKCVTIPSDQFEDVLVHGKWFDGSAIESFARVAETDMYLRPDLATYAEVPWRTAAGGGSDDEGRVGRIICDVLMPSGERFQGDPRAILGATLEYAAKQGFVYEAAPELEFFLLQEGEGGATAPLAHDRGGYFDLSTDLAADVRREIVSELAKMGIRIEACHHEVAAGQHEVDFVSRPALETADAIATTRYAIKAIAQRYGLLATFLPKPFFGINGSGMHTHQRLLRLADGSNAFADMADEQYGLSAIGRHFVAGQLLHAPGISAVLGPLVNSYKRLVPGFEAPVMISWGRVNREALVRVPKAPAGTSSGTRVELRSPDPSCNPYLAFAVMLRAGLDGVVRELPLATPVEEGLYTLDEQARLRKGIALLPTTLGEALAALTSDELVLDALGQQIAAWFIEAKTLEWQEYRCQVHPWELDRYLPLF